MVQQNSSGSAPSLSSPDPSKRGLTPTQKFIIAIFGAMVVGSVLSVIGLSVLNVQQHNTGSPTPTASCVRLQLGEKPANGGAAYTESVIESDFFGCQTVGMNEDAAMALLRLHNIATRISSRDGISFPLTTDYSDSRVNLTIMQSVVAGYEVG